ncbi:hypothetical protein HJC23_005340 [Cyclotella cryptica]|uniref:Uncharacterized protein n=1 Tax=Cyclotella cryptica TaxID=29204 RepID=A0ABD3PEI8_9STRA
MASKKILFVAADLELFKSCFIQGEWENCEFETAPDRCSSAQLTSLLTSNNLAAVVYMEGRTKHWEALKRYFDDGGVLVFFGIVGEFGAPYHFSSRLGFTWRFSAYTAHEFRLTPKAMSYLGSAVIEQQYTKSNLISAPEEDRWMVPKAPTMEEYLSDYHDFSDEQDAAEDELEEIKEAREEYVKYVESLNNQCPLAVHENSNGGKFIYLGFVNGDGNIPKFVRGLFLGEKTSA